MEKFSIHVFSNASTTPNSKGCLSYKSEYNILCDNNWTNVFFVEICFLVINDNITEHFRKYFLEILKGFMT